MVQELDTRLDSAGGTDAPALDLRMLRPLEASRDGQQLSLGGQRQRSLQAWADVDRMLVDGAALVPIYTTVATAVVSPKVGNVLLRPGLGPVLDQIWVR